MNSKAQKDHATLIAIHEAVSAKLQKSKWCLELKAPREHLELIRQVRFIARNLESEVTTDGKKISIKTDNEEWVDTKEKIVEMAEHAAILADGLDSLRKNSTFGLVLNTVLQQGPDYEDHRFNEAEATLPDLKEILGQMANVHFVARRRVNRQWISGALIKCRLYWLSHQAKTAYPKFEGDSNQIPFNPFTLWVVELVNMVAKYLADEAGENARERVLEAAGKKPTSDRVKNLAAEAAQQAAEEATVTPENIKTELIKLRRSKWKIPADSKLHYYI